MRVVLLGVVLLLAACTSPAERAAEEQRQREAIANNMRAQCRNYGFQQGTAEYAQCLMTLDQQRQAAHDALVRSLLFHQ